MDVLIISSNVILILEVKNWSGTLLFAENNQVIRMKNRVKEGFYSPISQVKLQKHRLSRWLRENDFSEIPIHYLIVISFPSTVIRPASTKCTIPEEVIHSNELFNHVNRITTSLEAVLKEAEMLDIAMRLKESHVLPCDDVMKKYNIDPKSLVKGVICPECGFVPMSWLRSKWICTMCKQTSTTAHIQAIAEYKLLIGNTTTNKQMRDFLQIESRHVMKRLFQKLDLEELGTRKGRKYTL